MSKTGAFGAPYPQFPPEPSDPDFDEMRLDLVDYACELNGKKQMQFILDLVCWLTDKSVRELHERTDFTDLEEK